MPPVVIFGMTETFEKIPLALDTRGSNLFWGSFDTGVGEDVPKAADRQVQMGSDVRRGIATIKQFERLFHVSKRTNTLALKRTRRTIIHNAPPPRTERRHFRLASRLTLLTPKMSRA